MKNKKKENKKQEEDVSPAMNPKIKRAASQE